MKKLVSIILAILTAAPVFCACSAKNRPAAAELPATTDRPNAAARETVPTPEPEKQNPPENKNIEIILDEGFTFRRSPIFGTRRHFRNISGEYSVEYVHTPYGITSDDTLSYDITVNADNTYTMTVVSDGITSNHNGRWYESFGGITFYFDERVEPPAHNEYVSDSMYADTLPHGKLMVYDKGLTIVLSRKEKSETPEENVQSLFLVGTTTAHKQAI